MIVPNPPPLTRNVFSKSTLERDAIPWEMAGKNLVITERVSGVGMLARSLAIKELRLPSFSMRPRHWNLLYIVPSSPLDNLQKMVYTIITINSITTLTITI